MAIIIELAVESMKELMTMTQMGEPLWMSSQLDGMTAALNENEYIRLFPRGVGPKPTSFNVEASKETAVVTINHINLVDILMDVDQWSTVFSGIVSRATTLEVMSKGVAAGNWNGTLLVMKAEYQLPTTFVQTRDSYFARYCRQHSDGRWAVVDVSLDAEEVRCRRRPSGCLIQEMPNGYSQVTWVEHVEVDDRGVHNLYKQLVSSGYAFGAKRWVGYLDRQYQWLASVIATINIQTGAVAEESKNVLKLGQRMAIHFCAVVSASIAHTWTTLAGSGDDDLRFMTRKSVGDPGTHSGVVLMAATSLRLPVPPKTIFDFLCDVNSRDKWDILSFGALVNEVRHIASGRDTNHCVSLLRVYNGKACKSNMLVIQESWADPTTSFVIYSPVDLAVMDMMVNGGDPDSVAILPSGFAILPDGHNPVGGSIGESGGSLLTVAFQILVHSDPTARVPLSSFATINRLIVRTVERIKISLSFDNEEIPSLIRGRFF